MIQREIEIHYMLTICDILYILELERGDPGSHYLALSYCLPPALNQCSRLPARVWLSVTDVQHGLRLLGGR